MASTVVISWAVSAARSSPMEVLDALECSESEYGIVADGRARLEAMEGDKNNPGGGANCHGSALLK